MLKNHASILKPNLFIKKIDAKPSKPVKTIDPTDIIKSVKLGKTIKPAKPAKPIKTTKSTKIVKPTPPIKSVLKSTSNASTKNTNKVKFEDTPGNASPISEEDNWDKFMESFNSNEPVITTDVATTQTKTFKSNVDNMSLDITPEFKIDAKATVCPECDGDLTQSDHMMVCKSCGLEIQGASNLTEEEYSTSAATDCNVNSKGFIAIKMSGKGSYGYQRSMLKTCANYSTYRKNNTLKDLNNWNAQSKKHHIPKNVIQEANNMFAIIKDHGYVYRKDGKKGVLSACLYYACYNNGITKTPSEIAQFSNIEEKFHSLGDRILHDLNEKGVITIPTKVNPIVDYVERYMELLNIPIKYKAFVIDLINCAEKKNIHVIHDSKMNSKAIGAIYMLINRIPELRNRITKDMIEEQYSISRTTFIRYYNMLCAYYKKIKKVFKKHSIPMPIEWKD